LGEVKEDIDRARKIADLLESASWEMGLGGWIRPEGIAGVIRNHPEIYGEYASRIKEKQWLALRNLHDVAHWLMYAAQRVFLQDADALFMKPKDLVEVLGYLKKTFPIVETVTCYARSKTCAQRSLTELRELNDAGLSWCFVGIESGWDEVLDFMRKGAGLKEHIDGGQKLMASGIKTAAFVMPGLAGGNRERSERHIRDTLKALNEIRPTEVRLRSLVILESAPLYEKWKSGEFQAPGEDQMVDELKVLIEGLTFDCTLETLQMTNAFTLRGPLPGKKKTFLESIGHCQKMSPLERARFLLRRYLNGGYLGVIQSWGNYDSRIKRKIEEAEKSLENQAPDALAKVEQALLAIKSKGIP